MIHETFLNITNAKRDILLNVISGRSQKLYMVLIGDVTIIVDGITGHTAVEEIMRVLKMTKFDTVLVTDIGTNGNIFTMMYENGLYEHERLTCSCSRTTEWNTPLKH